MSWRFKGDVYTWYDIKLIWYENIEFTLNLVLCTAYHQYTCLTFAPNSLMGGWIGTSYIVICWVIPCTFWAYRGSSSVIVCSSLSLCIIVWILLCSLWQDDHGSIPEAMHTLLDLFPFMCLIVVRLLCDYSYFGLDFLILLKLASFLFIILVILSY